jgi:cytochrome c
MTFAGLKRPDERTNVIAYLRTLSDSPVPLPEVPTAAATDGEAGTAAEHAAPPPAEQPATEPPPAEPAPPPPAGGTTPEAPAE